MTLTDYDVEPFDVTAAPDADVDLPIEQRSPGGLGLHLIRRLAGFDRVRVFEGDSGRAGSRFRKTRRRPSPTPGTRNDGGEDAGNRFWP